MCSSNKRILIVEDTLSTALFLSASLCNDGFNVEIAETGRDALILFEEAACSPDPFDLLLVDMNLPDVSGVEFLNCISSFVNCPSAFILSADGSEETRARAFSVGARLFFEKPLDMATLKQSIFRLLLEEEEINQAPDDDAFLLEKKRLEVAYRQYLVTLTEKLVQPIPRKKLASLLHQLKGSASLYELQGLSKSVQSLGKELADAGTEAAGRIRKQLRRVLQAETNLSNSY